MNNVGIVFTLGAFLEIYDWKIAVLIIAKHGKTLVLPGTSKVTRNWNLRFKPRKNYILTKPGKTIKLQSETGYNLNNGV